MNLKLWLNFVQFLATNTKLNENAEKLNNFLSAVQQEANFETILYVEPSKNCKKTTKYFSTDVLLSHLQAANIAVLQLNQENDENISKDFNKSKLLTLIVLEPALNEAKQQLQALWPKLAQLRQTSTILLLENNVAHSFIQTILHFCVENKAINTIALSASNLQQATYYGMQIFPKFKVELRNFARKTLKIFPNHIANMQQYPIRVVRNIEMTKSYFYINNKGQRIYSGIYGKFIKTFAEKHNATLSFPWRHEPERLIHRDVCHEFLQNNSHDITTEISLIEPKPNISYTNVYEHMDRCLMVPAEKPLPSYRYYIMIYDNPSILLLLLTSLLLVLPQKLANPPLSCFKVAIHTFNGLLGQSFQQPSTLQRSISLLYLITTFTGLIFNALYAAKISSFKTSPPMEPYLTSVTQLQDRVVNESIVGELIHELIHC